MSKRDNLFGNNAFESLVSTDLILGNGNVPYEAREESITLPGGNSCAEQLLYPCIVRFLAPYNMYFYKSETPQPKNCSVSYIVLPIKL